MSIGGGGGPIRGRLDSIIDMSKQNSNDLSENLQTSFTRLPNLIRRRFRKTDGSSLITMFPVAAVTFSLLLTLFILPHSGILDCRDGFDNPSICNEEPALNVNGDLEVYLPTDEDPYSVKNLIKEVEDDWTTNVMVIYVESYNYNVTDVSILDEIDKVERGINQPEMMGANSMTSSMFFPYLR